MKNGVAMGNGQLAMHFRVAMTDEATNRQLLMTHASFIANRQSLLNWGAL